MHLLNGFENIWQIEHRIDATMASSDKKLIVAILGVGAIGRGVANALGRDRRMELRLFDPITEKDKYREEIQ